MVERSSMAAGEADNTKNFATDGVDSCFEALGAELLEVQSSSSGGALYATPP